MLLHNRGEESSVYRIRMELGSIKEGSSYRALKRTLNKLLMALEAISKTGLFRLRGMFTC